MQTYIITIKDNSIPPHLLQPNAITEYTASIDCNNIHVTPYATHDIRLHPKITDYIENMAIDLNTDPESLEILSIIKQ